MRDRKRPIVRQKDRWRKLLPPAKIGVRYAPASRCENRLLNSRQQSEKNHFGTYRPDLKNRMAIIAVRVRMSNPPKLSTSDSSVSYKRAAYHETRPVD